MKIDLEWGSRDPPPGEFGQYMSDHVQALQRQKERRHIFFKKAADIPRAVFSAETVRALQGLCHPMSDVVPVCGGFGLARTRASVKQETIHKIT